MKVSELIEKLKDVDPNLAVMVSGYEYGVQEDFTAEQKSISLNYWGEGGCGGEHGIKDGDNSGYETIEAFVIER